MSVEFSGAKAGTSVFTVQPDGAFSSETEFMIGTLKLKSSMSGQMTAGRVTSYRVDQQQPGGATGVIEWDGSKIKVTQGGKTQEMEQKYAGTLYFGNLHPMLNKNLLQAADWANKTPQKLKAFLLDGGAVIDLTVQPKGEKRVSAGSAKLYDLSIGMVTPEYATDQEGNVVAMDVPSQKLRFVAEGWESLYADPLAAYPELSQPTFEVAVDKGVTMKTRDGVSLACDVIRPSAAGKYPVILVRTPYGRASSGIEGPFYAKRGYVYVAQDCRGRGDSGGAWDPFVNESKDGYDTVAWVAKQPWSNGKVGMIGGSYGGLVQWAAAVEHPSALKCLVPQVSPPDAMRNIPYDFGTFFLYGNLWWGKIVRGKDADMSGLMSSLPHPEKLNTLPLSKVDDAVLGYNVPFFDKWLEREGMVYWKGFDWSNRIGSVTIPALHISGWWDGDLIGTQTNWASLRAAGRKNQWLVYGPWTHSFNSSSKLGDVDYGSSAILELDSLYLRWFDTWLKGKNVGFNKIPKVRAFVTGANKWVNLEDWPSKTSKPKSLYLYAAQPANGNASKGELGDRPQSSAPSKFTHDPHYAEIPKEILNVDPTSASTVLKLGKRDQSVLIYKTAPLPKATAIAGPIQVSLRFQTSARDTDFYALLLDIDEKGEMRQFGKMGKIRAAFLGGLDKPRPITPNKTFKADILLWDTAHELKKGHRLGLLITSEMFPVYARNLGTGEPIKNATRMMIQKNTIFHDAKNPSVLTFRVLW
jgi:putative CocE/NonD family hydrolase